MVDNLVPELELSAWEGDLGDLEVASSISETIPTVVEKRPRIIAAATCPAGPDGSTGRKRLFIVEPLGMWVKNGQAVPANPTLSASTFPNTARAVVEPVSDHAASSDPLDKVPANGAKNDLKMRGIPYTAGGGRQPGDGALSTTLSSALSTALTPVLDGELEEQQLRYDGQPLQQQQYQSALQRYPPQAVPQQHYHQQLQPQPQPVLQQPSLPELVPVPEGSGYPGPVRRLAPSLSFPQHLLQAASVAASRFQPYTSCTPSSSPSKPAPGLVVPGGGSRLPLVPPLALPLGEPGVRGGGGTPCSGLPGDAMVNLMQCQGSGWLREAAPSPQLPPPQLLRHESLPAAAAANGATCCAPPPSGTGTGITTMWHTWMRGEDVPLAGGGVVCGNGGIPQAGVDYGSVRVTVGQSDGGGAGGNAVNGNLPLQVTGPAAPPPPSTGSAVFPRPLAQLQHQQLQLQQQLLLNHFIQQQHRQQQQRHPMAAPQRPSLASAAWSDGCAEIWAVAFGEPAPAEAAALQPAPPRAPQPAGADVPASSAAGSLWPASGGCGAHPLTRTPNTDLFRGPEHGPADQPAPAAGAVGPWRHHHCRSDLLSSAIHSAQD